jgi:hypothetical protein
MATYASFLVSVNTGNIKLPSDLAGVTLTGFRRRDDGNLQAAVGPCCFKIKTAMEELGVLVKMGRLRQIQGTYSVYRKPDDQVVGERVELRYIGRRTFATKSTGPVGDNWEGYVTMSEQLPGYGTGVFRYLREGGCGLQQIWLNPRDGSLDVRGVNSVGGTNPNALAYTLRKAV